ncbi:hypothetical protein ASPWEDRAFT_47460 [Aspergillus wentii DTO 134E9]|uniref:A-kinase anchor protein 7-like phosphoesterase domain-containing protein n=1 Tax=Aspergillus wentii DTO 134E9 TaxID=1073089 RepID=A0A1L9S0H7_ASPWE|nr:uncharacterized protein ASPWEDRAFT_47460 [Aspergillus wentii DTO 134E9]OJJ40676.1 hypothetical protein ASPWEDRAFT_47460 [Aspergillus wentii DTO 134E9]
MPDRKNTEASKNNVKEKRPPLTHFLCLPLVNPISFPQLESSLATFKAAIPSVQPTHQDGSSPGSVVEQPLFPDSALRPIGTLHLTLGVMSLPTKERLNEALEFFQSLDLVAMIREAENMARNPKKGKGASHLESSEGSISRESSGSDNDLGLAHDRPRPFSISLESLHAFPRARSATVLHAAPVDPTSRLYPFCEMLRDKFLEAGFMQGEYKDKRQAEGAKESQQEQSTTNGENNGSDSQEATPQGRINEDAASCQDAIAEERSLGEMPVGLADDSARRQLHKSNNAKRASVISKPKARPLTLHATVVNTIYVRGRRRNVGLKNGNRKNNQHTFDARDIIAHYRSYNIDSQKTMPWPDATTIAAQPKKSQDQSLEKRRVPLGEQSADDNTRSPFVWARDFPLETVCICEMGAKKLDPGDVDDNDGMNARLGEKYMAVAERSLDFEPSRALQALDSCVKT